MFEITARKDLSATTHVLEVAHPALARAVGPGQFVVVMLHERSERVPLTIADCDRERGTITLVVQAAGKSTHEMRLSCRAGTRLFAVAGPMGRPARTGAWRTAVAVGGGVGVASLLPHLRAWKERGGVHVVAVVGFRTAALAFWEERLAATCDELVLCTDDGSRGLRGRVTDGLATVLRRHPDLDHALVVGPTVMMRACAETTRPRAVPTLVSLNPIMLDGMGLCGGCRVTVAGRAQLTCVDGPFFDGHQVDFDELVGRLRRFEAEEVLALARFGDRCQLLAAGAHR